MIKQMKQPERVIVDPEKARTLTSVRVWLTWADAR